MILVICAILCSLPAALSPGGTPLGGELTVRAPLAYSPSTHPPKIASTHSGVAAWWSRRPRSRWTKRSRWTRRSRRLFFPFFLALVNARFPTDDVPADSPQTMFRRRCSRQLSASSAKLPAFGGFRPERPVSGVCGRSAQFGRSLA